MPTTKREPGPSVVALALHHHRQRHLGGAQSGYDHSLTCVHVSLSLSIYIYMYIYIYIYTYEGIH